jgi:hypothetical protein
MLAAVTSPRQRYEIRVDDVAHARGADASLSFDGSSGHTLAPQVESALRGDGLFQRWRGQQEDPDKVDESLAQSDPSASVAMTEKGHRVDLVVTTSLPYAIVKHRLALLMGPHWSVSAVRTP